jgi:hypothetical protein
MITILLLDGQTHPVSICYFLRYYLCYFGLTQNRECKKVWKDNGQIAFFLYNANEVVVKKYLNS